MNFHDVQSNGSLLMALCWNDYIVLVRQPGKPAPLYWKLPGGRIKPGESVTDAAIREVSEETAIDISSDEIRPLDEFQQGGASGAYTQHFLAVRFMTPDKLQRHLNGLVDVVDPDKVKLESTCFRISLLEGMKDLMPKHKKFLRDVNILNASAFG